MHLGLFERGRQWQIGALVERIRAMVPRTSPLIIAGDFNDWRRKANRVLCETLNVTEVFEEVTGRPGAHVPLGDADVPPRPHLCARARRRRRARPLRVAVEAHVRPRRARGHLRAVAARAQPRERPGSRFTKGNRVGLLRSGREYFPELISAIEAAEREVWLETYIFADDPAGRMVADALVRAAQRGVVVRVLVDGWGARHYLTPPLEQLLLDGGVDLLRYRPDIAPWNFRSQPAAPPASQAVPRRRARRVRRRHQRDRRPAHAGPQAAARRLRRAARGPRARADRATRCSACGRSSRSRSCAAPTCRCSPTRRRPSGSGTQVAKFVVRDNLRHRSDIERAYMAAIRTARREIVIATAYFFPGAEFRHALIAAAARGVKVTLLLQARVEYRLLHHACRALYGQLLVGNVSIHEYHRSFLHAKVAVVDDRWATVGSSNIDPYSFLMAREANVFVRDPYFADQLRYELLAMIETGARPVERRAVAAPLALREGADAGWPTASCASRWACCATAATSGGAGTTAVSGRRLALLK